VQVQQPDEPALPVVWIAPGADRSGHQLGKEAVGAKFTRHGAQSPRQHQDHHGEKHGLHAVQPGRDGFVDGQDALDDRQENGERRSGQRRP